jgi:hypothetical protein
MSHRQYLFYFMSAKRARNADLQLSNDGPALQR